MNIFWFSWHCITCDIELCIITRLSIFKYSAAFCWSTIIPSTQHTPTLSACLIFLCVIMSFHMRKAYRRPLWSLNAAQTAWCSKSSLLSMVFHRSELRVASNTTLLVPFGAPSRLNQGCRVIKLSWEHGCRNFYVLQLGSQSCVSSHHCNLISLPSSPTGTQSSTNQFSFHFHASKLYVFFHSDGQPHRIRTKFGKHGYLNKVG